MMQLISKSFVYQIYMSHFRNKFNFLIVTLLFLSSCSFGGEKVSMLHLRIGSTILEFDQMQAKDWSVPPKRLAYIGQINVRSPVKVELGGGIVLDIPYARTMLVIENTRLRLFNLIIYPRDDQNRQHEAKALYDQLHNVLEQHPDWEFNEKLDRWMRTKDIAEGKGSEEFIQLNLRKDDIRLSHSGDIKLSDCLSPLHDHRGLFEKEKVKIEPDSDRRVDSLSGVNIEAIKVALDIIGREDPVALPLEEYVSRVNKFMEIRCPDMLEQYGQ